MTQPAAPLDLDAIQARTVADKELRGAVVTAIVDDATKPRAERLGLVDAMLAVVWPVLDRKRSEVQRLTARAVEENQRAHRAEGRLDAALDVVEQWTDHCIGPQTRNLLDEIRAVLNPQPAPGGPQAPV
ncbi:hypothetical protein ACGFZP_12885 [Kitasatospora sp. NPDC048239]|uniref:hypothetical protein n=1 Tax=Kitasatospora sp. NPDC048239 TaxID=3364046 RepID=UPI003722D80E